MKTLLKTKEAAAQLGVSVSTLEKWRARGQGPAYRRPISGMVRYHVDDLAAFQQACIVEPHHILGQ